MPYPLLRLIQELVLPPLGPFALLALAFFLRARLHRIGLALGLLAMAWMLVFSLPGTYRWLRSPWPELPERIAPPYPAADAIVVLGGGRYLGAPEYGGDTAGPSTLERVRYAAKLQRETGLPILVSGGKQGGFGSRSEAEIMQDILEGEYGLSVRWAEPDSGDTRENARNSANLLQADAIQRVLLVTHATHMPRAAQEFEDAGIHAVPMPIGFERPDETSIHLWIPSAYGLALNRTWLNEHLASLRPN
jgi:uncharacterized SAM-binding protein YcdF (DUF218 family)